jgi:2-polyprenyl-3-methyl-5-hydroxy-6-metoxy-1,4-benzoquinol methylase
MKNNSKCGVCGGPLFESGPPIYDDRYGYPGNFYLLKCNLCGHIVLQATFSPEEITNLYSEYYPRASLNVDEHQPHQECVGFKAWFDGANSRAFRWVPRNMRVLDIGCGFGESLGYHQARGCEVYGVEADQNVLRVAEKFGYKVYVGLFNPNAYDPCFFDYVTMDQVIEHVQNPVETLRGIARVLKHGGTAILSVPNAEGWGARLFGRRWINWHAPYHVQFFSVSSMQMVAEKAGLVLERSETITTSEWLFYQWIHLATYPKMGMPSSFWAPDGRPSLVEKCVMKFLELINRTGANQLLTRFFDSLGLGDSQLYFLKKP